MTRISLTELPVYFAISLFLDRLLEHSVCIKGRIFALEKEILTANFYCSYLRHSIQFEKQFILKLL